MNTRPDARAAAATRSLSGFIPKRSHLHGSGNSADVQAATFRVARALVTYGDVCGRNQLMHRDAAVEAELSRSAGLSMEVARGMFAAGGDMAETKFMECCWRLWKANGSELLEPFVESMFNDLPKKSRAVLFQRMLTIVYVAQEIEIKKADAPLAD
jgi:hypothetical protein